MKAFAIAICLCLTMMADRSHAANVESADESPLVTQIVGQIIEKLKSVKDERNTALTRSYGTNLYFYTLNIYTGYVSYVNYTPIGYYTVSSAKSELRGMGCSYWQRLSGSVIAPAWSNLLVDVYDCGSYWNSYAGVAYFSGYSSADAIFWYQKVTY